MNEFEAEMGAFFENALETFPTDRITCKGGTVNGVVDIQSTEQGRIKGGRRTGHEVEIHLLEDDRIRVDIKVGTVLTVVTKDDLKVRVTELRNLMSAQRTLVCGPVNQI